MSQSELAATKAPEWPTGSKFPDERWRAAKKAYETGQPINACMFALGCKNQNTIRHAITKYGWTRPQATDDGRQSGEYVIPRHISRRADIQRALEAVRNGASRQVAAAIGSFTMDEFTELLDSEERLAREFDRAEADLVHEMLQQVRRDAKNSSRAAQWMLERHKASKEDFKSAEPERASKQDGPAIQVVLNIERGTADDASVIDVTPSHKQIDAAK